MAATERVYRKVYLRLWRHRAFAALSDGEKLLTLYLVSGPQTNAIGCYYFSPGLACEDLGISPPQLRRRLDRVLAAFGWQHDTENRLIWITSWLRWNKPNGVNAAKAWHAEIDGLPECEAKRWLRDAIGTPSGRRRDAVATQEQEQEQEQDREQYQPPERDQPRQTAVVNGSLSQKARPVEPEAIVEFLEGYRARYERITGGSLPVVWSAKDSEAARQLLQTWPVDRLLDMAELFLYRDDRDVAGKPKTLPFFKPMAPWCDARLREAGR